MGNGQGHAITGFSVDNGQGQWARALVKSKQYFMQYCLFHFASKT